MSQPVVSPPQPSVLISGAQYTEGFLYRVLKDIGVPFVLAYIILTSLTPKIDEGIRIANRVDAQLSFELQQHAQILADCGLTPIRVVTPSP